MIALRRPSNHWGPFGLTYNGCLTMSALGITIVLVATFRTLGLPVVIGAAVFLIYGFYGDQAFIPDSIQWKDASFNKAMWRFWMQTEGVFGHGAVYTEVLEVAVSTKVNLIVLASHRPARSDYLLCPNAVRIVRHANQSVFAVRP